MFALVADVERYPEFLPWCAATRVTSRAENTFTADVLAAFGALRERFTSRVMLDPAGRMITIDYLEGPFKHLHNTWRFTAREGGCDVVFEIDFAFKSRALEALIAGVFVRAIEKMTAAFDERARALYGAPVSGELLP
jgi:coenzyme Q-binding protein COQ10